MKKYWLIPLMMLACSPYANSCGGQFDPATGTCRIIGPDGRILCIIQPLHKGDIQMRK